jgi:hypothetical protein
MLCRRTAVPLLYDVLSSLTDEGLSCSFVAELEYSLEDYAHLEVIRTITIRILVVTCVLFPWYQPTLYSGTPRGERRNDSI